MRATLEQIDRYLRDKTKRSTCPFCDCEDWEVLALPVNEAGEEDPTGEMQTLDVLLNAFIDRRKELQAHASQIFSPHFLLNCKQCGFTRLQAAGHFEKWLREQSREG